MTTSTRTTEKPTYTDEQRRLIDKYRDMNVDHFDWWDCVYDDFIATAKTNGFLIHDHNSIQFRGFWSQGDGASFTGTVDAPKFIAFHKLESAYPWIMKMFDYDGSVGVEVTRNHSWYSHEHTCRAEVNDYDDFSALLCPSDFDIDDVRVLTLEQWNTQLQSDIDQLEKDVEQTRLELCRELYRSLETEYEHLTSDEVVWDSIVANELDCEPTEEDDQ